MMVVALGMGLSRNDFMDLTPFQFCEVLKEKQKTIEEKEKSKWERARYIAFAAVMPYLDPKKTNTPQTVFPVPWDPAATVRKVKPSTRERFDELKEKWK
jgi:hypothetical protein